MSQTNHIALVALLASAMSAGAGAVTAVAEPVPEKSAATVAGLAGDSQGEQWNTSWLASPQALWGPDFVLPTNIPARLHGQSVRELIRLSAGGSRLRLVFSNRYGSTPLTIGEVRVARAPGGIPARGDSGMRLTFGGRRTVTVPPGADAQSDPLPVELAALTRLAVSSYYPHKTALSTFHWGGQQTALVKAGNATAASAFDHAQLVQGRLFLTAAQVAGAPGTRTVVAFGDSITDGNGSTPDHDRRWTDYLAQRFAGQGVAVANAGISGARVLGARMGDAALARFEHDVLAVPGAKSVILLMGINDIGWPGSPFAPQEPALDLARLTGAYQQLIARARLRKLRIIGATLPPFEDALHGTPFAGHFSPAKEVQRQQLNAWIRNAGAFDQVVDFDALLRDPARPARMRAGYDSGDHLHPGDAGYKAMADAFDLGMLFGDVADGAAVDAAAGTAVEVAVEPRATP